MNISEAPIDYLIIGGGVIGLSLGINILESNPNLKVVIYEKEKVTGFHASGRNSGVIHAGFYYSPDSLKAKFCRDGNIYLRDFCKKNDVPMLKTGKVVVCRDEIDLQRIEKLYANGVANGVEIELLNSSELKRIEPAAKTFKKFIWSPNTAVTSPKNLSEKLEARFTRMGGVIKLGKRADLLLNKQEVIAKIDSQLINSKQIINCAGALAAELAHQIKLGKQYLCIPFLGSYKIAKQTEANPKRLIYPVPNPINPFLGVHTTNTVDGYVKLGPNAFPVIGKEQYKLLSKVKFGDLVEFARAGLALRKGQNLQLIKLGFQEGRKLRTKTALKEISYLADSFDSNKNWQRYPAGIRAQIVNINTGKLEMDYIVEKKANSIHILNAVSPGWTSAHPFSRWLIESNKLS